MGKNYHFPEIDSNPFKSSHPLLIVGLGNPGYPSGEVSISRQNVGFAFINYLQLNWRYPNFQKHKGTLSEVSESQRSVLAKPLLQMNLSGTSVNLLRQHYKNHHLLIVHDELDKPIGRFSFKTKGSARGHGGLLSIMDTLETDRFMRLSIGIDRPNDKNLVPQYVFSVMSIADSFTLRNKTFEELSTIISNWGSVSNSIHSKNLQNIASTYPTSADIEFCKISTSTLPKRPPQHNSSYNNYMGKFFKHLKR